MSAIKRLFFPSRPATIPWGIRTIVVRPAVNTVFGTWLTSHVGQKIREIIPPFVKDYASTSVVRIIFSFGIKASLAKRPPRYPFGGFAFSMFVISLAKAVFSPASAGFRSSASQICSMANALIATITLAKPTCLVVSNFSKGNDSKSFKTLACKIYTKSRHEFLVSWIEQNVNSV
jgi:hypothetical protein